MAHPEKKWETIIAHMDMDAFFASIEQRDNPDLQGKPIGILNSQEGTTIITCSYEARAYGIRTGMHLKKAKQLCPDFLPIVSRPHRYAETSKAIMDALIDITPDIEIFSIDEAFLDLTQCKALYHYPKEVGQLIQKKVYHVSGVTCSVGVSSNKSNAKFASKLQKPNGLMVIPPWRVKEALAPHPIGKLCGIGPASQAYLKERGIETCGQIERISIEQIEKDLGVNGKRIWLMAHGCNDELIHINHDTPKSMSASKVTPPNTTDYREIDAKLYYCCDKIAERLRQAKLFAERALFYLQYRNTEETLKKDYHVPNNDPTLFYHEAKALLKKWRGQGVYKVGVCIDRLSDSTNQQVDLFAIEDPKKTAFNALRDQVSARFGRHAISTAKHLQIGTINEVIPPSWKPSGAYHCVQGEQERLGEETKQQRQPTALKRPYKKKKLGETELGIKCEKKWRRLKDKPLHEKRHKTIQHLVYHGASYAQAMELIERVLKQESEGEV